MATQTATADWQKASAHVCQRRDDSIRKTDADMANSSVEKGQKNVMNIPSQILASRTIEITELPMAVLQSRLQSGELTALETVNAFLQRAALAQKLVNCITELLPSEARARATELDTYFRQHGKPVGPLHGIPVSVKEHIDIKGFSVNAAFASWIDRTASDDAHILKCLRDAGAVFHVRTTEPQALMHLETSSMLHGVTVNPYNTDLSCGGSSGGEGALIALRGSCLGIGTDIGGSIRSPASNNGLYGFKPTAQRMPGDGIQAAMSGSEHIKPTCGPISTSLEGIKLFMKSVLETSPQLREPSLYPMPWRDEVDYLRSGSDGKKITVAVLWHDEVVLPQPPVNRALKGVVEKLRGRPDVEVVDWKPYKHDYAWEILRNLYFPDAAQDILENLAAAGEPLLPLTEWIISQCNNGGVPLTVQETWAWQAKRNQYRTDYNAFWGLQSDNASKKVDVILCPVGPGPAPRLGTSKYWGYTSQWNLLDYPALVFPVTHVDKAVDVSEHRETYMSEMDKTVTQEYDPEVFHGVPICLQLVGRRFDDEKVIQAFDFIDHILKT